MGGEWGMGFVRPGSTEIRFPLCCKGGMIINSPFPEFGEKVRLGFKLEWWGVWKSDNSYGGLGLGVDHSPFLEFRRIGNIQGAAGV